MSASVSHYCCNCQKDITNAGDIWSISISGGKSYFYCSWDCYDDFAHKLTDCRHCGEKVDKNLIRKHLKKCPKKPKKQPKKKDRIQKLEARVAALEKQLQSTKKH